MPLYEYECRKCGAQFEVMQKFSDEPLKKHPDCGGKVERLISAPGLQFKGTGWYITDYARSGGAKDPGKSADSGESKPAETKSDSSASSTSSSEKTASKSTKKKK